jgi:hypothetical protein
MVGETATASRRTCRSEGPSGEIPRLAKCSRCSSAPKTEHLGAVRARPGGGDSSWEGPFPAASIPRRRPGPCRPVQRMCPVCHARANSAFRAPGRHPSRCDLVDIGQAGRSIETERHLPRAGVSRSIPTMTCPRSAVRGAQGLTAYTRGPRRPPANFTKRGPNCRPKTSVWPAQAHERRRAAGSPTLRPRVGREPAIPAEMAVGEHEHVEPAEEGERRHGRSRMPSALRLGGRNSPQVGATNRW